MKRFIIILHLLLICSFISFAQENDNSKTVSTRDSLKIKINSNPITKMQIRFDEFELYREFKDMKTTIPIDVDPKTVWLRTSLVISTTDKMNQEFSPHFLSPLQKQYLEDSKFDPIKSILGMAQVGAVGYLAYKHIKKYGFLK